MRKAFDNSDEILGAIKHILYCLGEPDSDYYVTVSAKETTLSTRVTFNWIYEIEKDGNCLFVDDRFTILKTETSKHLEKYVEDVLSKIKATVITNNYETI